MPAYSMHRFGSVPFPLAQVTVAPSELTWPLHEIGVASWVQPLLTAQELQLKLFAHSATQSALQALPQARQRPPTQLNPLPFPHCALLLQAWPPSVWK